MQKFSVVLHYSVAKSNLSSKFFSNVMHIGKFTNHRAGNFSFSNFNSNFDNPQNILDFENVIFTASSDNHASLVQLICYFCQIFHRSSCPLNHYQISSLINSIETN